MSDLQIKPVDEYADEMITPSSQRMAAFEATLKGVGGHALEEWKKLSEALSAMPGLGVAGRDQAATLRANTALPQDHRTKAAEETVEIHRTLLAKHDEFARAAAARLEGELQRGLLPQPLHHEHRLLVRDEIRNVLAGKTGRDLAKAALAYIGTNPSHDGELLSEWGRSLYQGQGVEKEYSTLQAQAVDRYLKRTDGSQRQVASRNALLAFQAANIAGAVAAYRHSGLMRLDRDAALPKSQLQVASVTARGKTVKR